LKQERKLLYGNENKKPIPTKTISAQFSSSKKIKYDKLQAKTRWQWRQLHSEYGNLIIIKSQ